MATGGVVISKDQITCDVCFNVYREPHTFPCLHTYCKACIEQLKKRGRVQCPICREQIRQDFRMQTLIDSHNGKQPGLPNRKELEQCKNVLLKLRENEMEVRKISCGIDVSVKAIAKAQKQEIKEAENLLYRAVATMMTNTQQKIKSANARKKLVLIKNKDVYKKVLSDINSKIDLVSTVIETGNTAEFKAKENDIKAVLDKVHKYFADVPSVTILAGDCSSLKQMVKIKVNPVRAIQYSTRQDFSKLARNSYRNAKRVDTGVKIHRMRMIDGKLYCAAGDDGIYVYSAQCKLIKKINHIKLGGVRSIAHYRHKGNFLITILK